jgi:hypothetical protein
MIEGLETLHMTESFSTLRINPDRMLDMFNQLALIGATGDGGVNRPTFSDAHLAARKWFREQIENSGLEFRMDGAGNHSAILPVTLWRLLRGNERPSQ